MVHQIVINFKKEYDSVRREVLYNILIEFGIPMKLFSLVSTSEELLRKSSSFGLENREYGCTDLSH
jgi:hypothetical protein